MFGWLFEKPLVDAATLRACCESAEAKVKWWCLAEFCLDLRSLIPEYQG
jgi:hypothetical protein